MDARASAEYGDNIIIARKCVQIVVIHINICQRDKSVLQWVETIVRLCTS